VTLDVDPELAGVIGRLVDRLRSAPESRLSRREERLGGRSVATAAHDLAQWCADAAVGVTHRERDTSPAAPAVPRLTDLAAADQLSVLTRELLDALARVDDQTPVWSKGGRSSVAGVRAQLREQVLALREVV